jgi:Na+(H+)/acetate symporter ActP
MRARRIFCATVLVCEAFVAFFALLVAAALSDVPAAAVVPVGVATILACLVLTGMLAHHWAYPAGSALQVLLIMSGVAVPAMYFVGSVFGLLWVAALMLSRRVERIQARHPLTAKENVP